MRIVFVLALGVGLTLTASACSSSGPAGSSPPTSPSGSTASSKHASSTAASTATSGSGIKLSGAFTGTITASLCTAGIASIAVTLNGDSTTYHGSISATSFGFVGPDAADYSLASGQPKPTAAADGSSFTVTGVTLVDLVSGKRLTATGTATCP
jgi:hypothetical protein